MTKIRKPFYSGLIRTQKLLYSRISASNFKLNSLSAKAKRKFNAALSRGEHCDTVERLSSLVSFTVVHAIYDIAFNTALCTLPSHDHPIYHFYSLQILKVFFGVNVSIYVEEMCTGIFSASHLVNYCINVVKIVKLIEQCIKTGTIYLFVFWNVMSY